MASSSTPHPHMTKFLLAMQHVYRFPVRADHGKHAWTPPPASGGHKGRYLWIDAFGVLNFITLSKETSSSRYLAYAESLVSTVHDVLGRTRDGNERLPGASEDEPLGGGLRIGKTDAGGSDGDGQYHHYLTLWMFALNRLSVASGNKTYNSHAITLAKAIHPRFVHDRDSDRPCIYWKMSVDLSEVLDAFEGNLDPIAGYVVFRLVQETDESEVLKDEIADYKKIVNTKWEGYSSKDPLDLGMTMWTAHWFADIEGEDWASGLAQRARRDLAVIFEEGYFTKSLRRRLAFREFGTALGIKCGATGEDWDAKAVSITTTWETAHVVPEPGDAGSASMNTSPAISSTTLVMYAAALQPGAFHKSFRVLSPHS